MRRLLTALHRALCGLHGHDRIRHFEPHRMCLRCVACGHQTRGWTIERSTPRVAARPRLQRFRERLRRIA